MLVVFWPDLVPAVADTASLVTFLFDLAAVYSRYSPCCEVLPCLARVGAVLLGMHSTMFSRRPPFKSALASLPACSSVSTWLPRMRPSLVHTSVQLRASAPVL